MSSVSLPEKLVKQYGTRNPYEIADAMNIKVHHLSHPESSCPGLTCLVANRPSIFLNDAYFERMQRRLRAYTDLMIQYDMAQVTGHELGHCVLHKDELRKAPIKEYEIFNVRTPLEAEANEFAAGLLIDKEEMLDLLHSDKTILQVSATMNVNVNLLIYMVELLRKQGYSINEAPYIPKNNFMGHIGGAGSSEWD